MRILLNESSKAALSRIQARCSEFNASIETGTGPFLMKLLCTLESHLDASLFKSIAGDLTSERVIRKQKDAQAKEFSAIFSMDEMNKLIKKKQKSLTQEVNKSTNNRGKSADF